MRSQTINVIARQKHVITLDALVGKNKIYCSNHCHKGNPCKNRGPPEISEVENGEVALHRAWGLCWEYSI